VACEKFETYLPAKVRNAVYNIFILRTYKHPRAWTYNLRPVTLYCAARGLIRKFNIRVYYKITQYFRRLGIPLMVILYVGPAK